MRDPDDPSGARSEVLVVRGDLRDERGLDGERNRNLLCAARVSPDERRDQPPRHERRAARPRERAQGKAPPALARCANGSVGWSLAPHFARRSVPLPARVLGPSALAGALECDILPPSRAWTLSQPLGGERVQPSAIRHNVALVNGRTGQNAVPRMSERKCEAP